MREPRLLQEADGGRPRRRRIRPQGRAVVEASLRADGFRLTLRAHGYEYPELRSGSDANWLNGGVDLAVRTFTARQSISLRTDELERFRDELRTLDTDLSGTAALNHLEEELGVAVALKDGRGTLSGFVREHLHAELRFEQIEIDQSFVRLALREFDELVRAFPPRGGPYA